MPKAYSTSPYALLMRPRLHQIGPLEYPLSALPCRQCTKHRRTALSTRSSLLCEDKASPSSACQVVAMRDVGHKLSLFQWIVVPQWSPTDKDSVPRCRRDLCWNLFSAVSGRTRILDQA